LPPNGTAGLARHSVSGPRREPLPPASTIASVWRARWAMACRSGARACNGAPIPAAGREDRWRILPLLILHGARVVPLYRRRPRQVRRRAGRKIHLARQALRRTFPTAFRMARFRGCCGGTSPRAVFLPQVGR
jgi:hypothetical protein